jgi:hypothetical protein
MNNPATRGFLGPLIITVGFTGGAAVATLYPVDPRQGTILSPDTDPNAVDPRKGTILN